MDFDARQPLNICHSDEFGSQQQSSSLYFVEIYILWKLHKANDEFFKKNEKSSFNNLWVFKC